MFPDIQKGKEAEVYRGVPPTAAPLITFCGFCGWYPWGEYGGNLEVTVQLPNRQLETTLLTHVRLREE